MRKLICQISLLLISISCFGQGSNNDYDIDAEDLKNIFEVQGIHIFKYPFNLKKGEYISISYEIYELGKIKNKKNIIEDFQIENEIEMNNHISRNDTIIYHRLYFHKKKDTLSMHEFLPGFEAFQEIDLSKIETGDFNSRTDINPELPEKTELMYYYGLFKNGDKIKKTNGWLNCSSGISKDKLIERYDFVILFCAEKIKKETTNPLLEKIKKIPRKMLVR